MINLLMLAKRTKTKAVTSPAAVKLSAEVETLMMQAYRHLKDTASIPSAAAKMQQQTEARLLATQPWDAYEHHSQR